MMEAFALLSLAVQERIHSEIAWCSESTVHASVNGTVHIVFLWGDGVKSAYLILTEFRAFLESRGVATALVPVSLVVLVNPKGQVPASFADDQITRAPRINAEAHLQPPGSVITGGDAHRQVNISDNDLYGPLANATTTAQLRTRLAQLLKEKGI